MIKMNLLARTNKVTRVYAQSYCWKKSWHEFDHTKAPPQLKNSGQNFHRYKKEKVRHNFHKNSNKITGRSPNHQ